MLVLASRSPTRKALLTQAGLRFATRAPDVDERTLEATAIEQGAAAGEIALTLAAAKARAAAAGTLDIVIGADQTLALGRELLHKPPDLASAREQLQRLRGKTHRLHAAVALVSGSALLWSHLETAELTLRDFSDAECDAVLALEGDAVLNSVGGYRLEGPSVRLLERVSGDYFTVLGLPLLPLLEALRKHAPGMLGESVA
jgi:septum formation protein